MTLVEFIEKDLGIQLDQWQKDMCAIFEKEREPVIVHQNIMLPRKAETYADALRKLGKERGLM